MARRKNIGLFCLFHVVQTLFSAGSETHISVFLEIFQVFLLDFSYFKRGVYVCVCVRVRLCMRQKEQTGFAFGCMALHCTALGYYYF